MRWKLNEDLIYNDWRIPTPESIERRKRWMILKDRAKKLEKIKQIIYEHK